MFGEPTYGVPTANQEYPLQDGAALNLTVAADADRNGQVFWPNPIFPDERYSESVVDPQDSRDTAAAAAVGWLLKQDACTN